MKIQTNEFRVPDIKCEGCTKRVKNILNRIEGVRSADVNLEDKSVTVEFDADLLSFDDMKQAIEKAGYSIER